MMVSRARCPAARAEEMAASKAGPERAASAVRRKASSSAWAALVVTAARSRWRMGEREETLAAAARAALA